MKLEVILIEKFERIICTYGKTECPYGRDHCWLGEIDVRCLNGIIELKERHCCKKKKNLKVIGKLKTT